MLSASGKKTNQEPVFGDLMTALMWMRNHFILENLAALSGYPDGDF